MRTIEPPHPDIVNTQTGHLARTVSLALLGLAILAAITFDVTPSIQSGGFKYGGGTMFGGMLSGGHFMYENSMYGGMMSGH